MKKRSVMASSNSQAYNSSGLKFGNRKTSSVNGDWIEKSRIAREAFMNKLNI